METFYLFSFFVSVSAGAAIFSACLYIWWIGEKGTILSTSTPTEYFYYISAVLGWHLLTYAYALGSEGERAIVPFFLFFSVLLVLGIIGTLVLKYLDYVVMVAVYYGLFYILAIVAEATTGEEVEVSYTSPPASYADWLMIVLCTTVILCGVSLYLYLEQRGREKALAQS